MEFIPSSLINDLNRLNNPTKRSIQQQRQKTPPLNPINNQTKGAGRNVPVQDRYSTSDTQQNDMLQLDASETRIPLQLHPSIRSQIGVQSTAAQKGVAMPASLDFTSLHDQKYQRGSRYHSNKREIVLESFSTNDNPSGKDDLQAISKITATENDRIESREGHEAAKVVAINRESLNGDVLPIMEDNVQQAHRNNCQATRKEVAKLKAAMMTLLDEIGSTEDQNYPTEMHAFLGIIQEEQKIYDSVFQEIIRQVKINMIERGEVVAEIRRRYANMFLKIPRHIRNIHTELIAQRKLNRRLSEELIRSKETVADLLCELDSVRKHDADVTQQAQEAQEKLVSVLIQSDTTDEILNEYHKLYRMQRDRLEDALQLSEQEKHIWVDAATSLAIRIGQEHGIGDLVLLQKHEHGRLCSTNHIITLISEKNDTELNAVEKSIEEWRSRLIRLSRSVIEEDHSNMETLAHMQRSMKTVLKNLTTNEPVDSIESDHPLLKVFHILDVKSWADHLKTWAVQEDIEIVRKMTKSWIDAGSKLLRRNEKTTNGKDYVLLNDALSKFSAEIEEWLTKLELRVSGEDGVASQVISLHHQLEDRFATYSSRDLEKPFPLLERIQLKETILHWTDQIGVLISVLANTVEREQHKIPLHVENWISRLIDQMNTDTDTRNEENAKLHTSMVSWMVQLLVKGGKETPSEKWDREFRLLSQELTSFNDSLTQDSANIEMISDDKKELRKVAQELCDNWIAVAKRLLAIEKKNALDNNKAGERKGVAHHH
ncbi:hypothetical protein BASA60_007309 [Batrachochytrium salamandrivorans]|nr:hypothetical protein BASA60_007309 [Batrachochytrium salamandrivorans]